MRSRKPSSSERAAGRSEHRVRWDVQLRGAIGFAFVAGTGIALITLGAIGEIRWWAVLVGALMLGLAAFGPAEFARKWRQRVVLNDEGIAWTPTGVSIPWSQIRRVNYVVEDTMLGPRTSAIEIVSLAGLVIRLGSDLTDWALVEKSIRARFGAVRGSDDRRHSERA